MSHATIGEASRGENEASSTYRYHGRGRRRGTKRSGRRSRERWEGTLDRRQLESKVSRWSKAHEGERGQEHWQNLPRPKTITYTPTTMELMEGGKNWLIPPSTMITPTAMLTSRLDTWISSSSSPSRRESGADLRPCRHGKNIQDVGEVHFDEV